MRDDVACTQWLNAHLIHCSCRYFGGFAVVRNGEGICNCNPRKPVFSRKEDSHSQNFDAALIVHLPSASFCFPALTALRHVAALLRKNFPEQRQKLCPPARALARSLVCPCKVGDWSEKRRQWREDLFTATDSDLDGDGLRSSHCRIFPRPRRNVT